MTPFKGHRLASCVASGTTEIQEHCQVCLARLRGPYTLSRTTDANLHCAFLEKMGGGALLALPLTSPQTKGGKREAMRLFTSKVHARVHDDQKGDALTFK